MCGSLSTSSSWRDKLLKSLPTFYLKYFCARWELGQPHAQTYSRLLRSFLAVRKSHCAQSCARPDCWGYFWAYCTTSGKKQKRGTRKYKDMCQIFNISLPPHSIRVKLLHGVVLLFPAMTAASPGVVWKQWSGGNIKAVIHDWLCCKWHQGYKRIHQ